MAASPLRRALLGSTKLGGKDDVPLRVEDDPTDRREHEDVAGPAEGENAERDPGKPTHSKRREESAPGYRERTWATSPDVSADPRA